MRIKKHVTLRFSILSLYIGTFIVLISIIIAVSSLFFIHSMKYYSSALLQNKSTQIIEKLKFKGNSPEILGSLTQFLFKNGYIDENQIIEYSFNAAKHVLRTPLKHPTTLVNWTDVKGNNISTLLQPDGSFSTTVIKPDAIPPVHMQIFRNLAGQLIKTKPIPQPYPNDYKYYLPAIKAKQFLWTDAFISYPHKNLVTAAVTPIYDISGTYIGVFSIYIPLESISAYLNTLKIGKTGTTFLMNGNNKLIAFPGMEPFMGNANEDAKFHVLSDQGKPWLKEVIHYHNVTKKNHFVYYYDNNAYIASFEPLPEEIPEVSDYNWKVGIVVPESDFTANLEKKNFTIVLLGLITLIIGITLASIFSKGLSARIKSLVNETKKIKQFNFDHVRIRSNITEVDALARAIHSIKMNLRAFQKYLPANLAKQLIRSGKDIQIGGEKKTISVLFTDVENFTSITETMDAEQLMNQLCEYLDALSTIITSTQGTIDKFIGDSVMAFWGAPLADKKHVEHACRTALLCKEKVKQLNKAWIKQNKMPFHTRFGVHVGEVIVGNIGSSERMNYTALGDTINMASRLEEMNKIYGTTIITSEAVKNLVAKKFLFRKIGDTVIKGKSGNYPIYELLGEKTNP